MGNMVKVTAEVNECKLGQGQINYLVRIENNPRIGRIRIQGLVRLGLEQPKCVVPLGTAWIGLVRLGLAFGQDFP